MIEGIRFFVKLRNIKMRKWGKVFGLLCLAQASNSYADAQLLKEPQVQVFVNQMVKKEHLSRKEVESAILAAHIRPDIVEKMDRPYEAKPWDVYAQLFLTASRIQAGAEFWKKHQNTLMQAEKHYGVPAQIIVSILGVETLYGQRQGDIRVLDALSTLAFHYPKRQAYFQYELKEYLLMCHEHHLNPTAQVGSYAGAMGQGQFMPGSYRRWAVKYQGNGAPDIIHNSDDAIMSIANYLNQHGWQSHQMIAQQAHASNQICQQLSMNLKKATYRYQDVVRCGVKPLQSTWVHPNQAGVLQMDIAKGHEYWIGYPNFYVILTYNSSPLYGLAVYLLSESIAKQV
jgi:membrane-bound lytic murein transglycosylase B